MTRPTAAALATQHARIAESRKEAAMTQEKHSSEPWVQDDLLIWGADEALVTRANYADARRIVAAVNACRGIPTEALEAGALRQIIEIADTAAETLDCLLEPEGSVVAHNVRRALAKLEGKA